MLKDLISNNSSTPFGYYQGSVAMEIRKNRIEQQEKDDIRLIKESKS